MISLNNIDEFYNVSINIMLIHNIELLICFYSDSELLYYGVSVVNKEKKIK